MQNITCRRRLWTFGVIFFAGLLVTSCMFHQKLPADWVLPPSVSDRACPDISGKYNNLGECANKAAASLAAVLFKDDLRKNPLSPLKDATHISIQQQEQNVVQISAWKNEEMLSLKTLSTTPDDFSCEEGWLKVASVSVGGRGVVIGTVQDTRAFAKSDGYLLEKIESQTMALLAVIPVVMSSGTWCRFAEIKDGNAKDNAPAATGKAKNEK